MLTFQQTVLKHQVGNLGKGGKGIGWVAAAHELMERKKEIIEILSDVDRYESDLHVEIEKEKKLRMAAEEKMGLYYWPVAQTTC